MFRQFLLAYLLLPVTLGLSWFWFLAAQQRYLWGHTTIGAARFHSTVTGKDLLVLHLVNLLLLLVTTGIAWPWARVRNLCFAAQYMTLNGPLDVARITQEAQEVSATGDELAGFLGFLDTGFDLG